MTELDLRGVLNVAFGLVGNRLFRNSAETVFGFVKLAHTVVSDTHGIASVEVVGVTRKNRGEQVNGFPIETLFELDLASNVIRVRLRIAFAVLLSDNLILVHSFFVLAFLIVDVHQLEMELGELITLRITFDSIFIDSLCCLVHTKVFEGLCHVESSLVHQAE